jgi:glycosyltransferase involved in cell wall biosynthesis
MFVDFDFRPRGLSMPRASVAPRPRWSVLIPFFNERDFIVATIESLAAQSVPVRLVLIDNASTDGSGALARAACERLGVGYELIVEGRAGKVPALAAGLRHVATLYVATCDADTWYPPHYLAAAQAVLERGHAVAGAFFADADADERALRRKGRQIAATAAVLRGQCHTGGAGQAFRTDTLRRAGGFDPDRWGWVLEDHEVIHRAMKHGTMGYGRHLWCCPAPRPRDRQSIRWTLGERLLYCVAAPVAGDWFFYRFLAGRLKSRRLTSERIRERQFQDVGRLRAGTPDPVCG